MPQYLDCYFLIADRAEMTVGNFLNRYLPGHKESAGAYEVPMHSDTPAVVFNTVSELLRYMEQSANEEYSVYWHNMQADAYEQHGMAHFTNDGCLILGVSVCGQEPGPEDVRFCKEVKNYLGSHVACITVEEPPPLNSIEFRQFAVSRCQV